MHSNKFSNKVKKYALISFLIPLLTINSCLLLYKFFGNLYVYPAPNFDYSKNEVTYSYDKYKNILSDNKSKSFTNCPKNYLTRTFVTYDGIRIETFDRDGLPRGTAKDNYIAINKIEKNTPDKQKIKSIILKKTNIKNFHCVKNYHFFYGLLKKVNFLESFLLKTILLKESSFAKVKNPYLYGEVSISRTARYFPAVFIFKPFIILSAFMLLLYCKSNLNLFNYIKNENKLDSISKKFFYFGVLSCLFLILHAVLLGVDYDSSIFRKIRRLIITLFIIFELTSQVLLTKNIFDHKKYLKKYINPTILKMKIIFVVVMFVITIISFTFLIYGDPTTTFKNVLEWNYFSLLLVYYLLSRLLWK